MLNRVCHQGQTNDIHVINGCHLWSLTNTSHQWQIGAKSIKKKKSSTQKNLRHNDVDVLEHTKLRHLWAQIVSWAPRRAQTTFIVLAPGVISDRHVSSKWHPFNVIFLWHKLVTWWLSSPVYVSSVPWLMLSMDVVCSWWERSLIWIQRSPRISWSRTSSSLIRPCSPRTAWSKSPPVSISYYLYYNSRWICLSQRERSIRFTILFGYSF